jgi:hypothetical protein
MYNLLQRTLVFCQSLRTFASGVLCALAHNTVPCVSQPLVRQAEGGSQYNDTYFYDYFLRRDNYGRNDASLLLGLPKT